MRRNFTLFFASLFLALGAWAQTPVLTYENFTAPKELSADDAATIRAMQGMTIVADVEITGTSETSLLFTAVADCTAESISDNDMWSLGLGVNALRYYIATRSGGYFSRGSVSTTAKKIIFTNNGTNFGFYIDGTKAADVLTVNGAPALSTYNGENAKFYLGGMKYNTDTEWGNFNGTISKVEIYSGVLTDDQIAALCYPEKAVTDYTKFVSGNVYTFQSKRGWLMASEGTDFVYSSGKLSDVTPAENNANCQWIYYATEKGKYLYNVGVNKFVTFNSANQNSIPLSETPNTSAIEVKNSTLGGYPILLGLESKVINQNLTNANFTYGACLWGDGWTGYQNDEGSACLVLSQGVAPDATLAAIKTKVDAFEADNTLAVAALDAAIVKAEAMAQYIGTGVGKYSTSDTEYATKFAAIKAFRAAIKATNTPTPAEVEAKTAEVEALIASFTLNMPEAGKYYTFSNDGYYITGNTTEDGSRIALSTTNDINTIYYFDGEHLLAYNTDRYMGLNATDWTFEAEDSEDISVVTFVASSAVAGAYNINCGSRWLHRTDAFINRCGSNTCGAPHAWIIEEVTDLPEKPGQGGETGIDAVEAEEEVVIYDLTGRRIEKMEKGIYIVNGRKVVIK